jgi:predicted signal transduction protein with EAL and GGDEF domain
LRAAIALAKELKLEVIVEGVETAKQLQRVKSCGGLRRAGLLLFETSRGRCDDGATQERQLPFYASAILLEALAGY